MSSLETQESNIVFELMGYMRVNNNYFSDRIKADWYKSLRNDINGKNILEQ